MTRNRFELADIDEVVEFTVRSWGKPGTLSWNGAGGTVIGRIRAIERVQRRPAIADVENLGNERTIVHIAGLDKPLDFPTSCLESVNR